VDDRQRELTVRYEQLTGDVEALLYRHDPIGIAFGDNPDEYSPEAGSIVPRLLDVTTVEDVQRIMHEEFVRWFDSDTAGPAADYQSIAEELWTLLRAG
jgi:hypothetical protein